MYHDVWQEMLAVRTALRYAQNQLTMDYSVPYLANPNALSAARARIANIPGLTLTLVQRAGVATVPGEGGKNEGKNSFIKIHVKQQKQTHTEEVLLEY